MLIYLVLLVIVLLYLLIFYKKTNVEQFSNQEYDIIISINAYREKWLIEILKNIKDKVKNKYLVIINPSKDLYEIMLPKKDDLLSKYNCIVNSDYLDKKRFHGSILHGICKNMKIFI